MAMPLNDVKQTGQKVEFGLKIAGASFQGSLNKEGTELALQLIQRQRAVDATEGIGERGAVPSQSR